MPEQCRFLLMPSSELQKVKPQFRDEVKQDSEKCIKEECPHYLRGECMNTTGGLAILSVGGTKVGSYLPPENYLV